MTIPADPAAALAEAVAPFGKTPADLENGETVSGLLLTATVVPSSVPAKPELERLLEELRTAFGASVTFTLSIGGAPVCSLAADSAAPELSRYDQIADAVSLDLDVTVDKDGLLAHWGVIADGCLFRLFLFPQRLVRALEAPLFVLANPRELLEGFAKAAKVIVLVPAHAIELAGPFLAILGGDAAPRWQKYAVAPRVARPSPADVLEQARRKWSPFDPAPLTPLQLAVEPVAVANKDAVAGALFAQWTVCSILYLADYSRWNENSKSWLVTFPGSQFDVSATLSTAAACVALDGEWDRARTLGALVRWAYRQERDVSDRLTTVQNAVTNVLEESGGPAASRKLIVQSEEIARRAAGAWKAFIRRKLDKYFSQVKLVEETVDATSLAYDEQTALLTKSLTDNMLAAAAIIAGSFIAAMFQSPFRPYVFWFGAGTYLTYLIFFPVAVGLTATKKRFNASRDAFAKRMDDFGQRLTPGEVHELAGATVQRRERAFLWWFGITLLLYAAVVGGLAVALFHVPPLIERWSDGFTITAVKYGAPANGAVQLQIRGTNFDRNKEIVVILGRTAYSNSAKTLTVFGSSLLTMDVPEDDLPRAGQTKPLPVVTVYQGKVTMSRNLPPR
jgi:hypothetical protein